MDPEVEKSKELERSKRKDMINEELNKIIKDTEEAELDDEMEMELVDALKQAAMKICYLKKYYDVFKDEFIYFPSVASKILDSSLLEEAEKYYYDEDDELPVLESAGLKEVVGKAAAAADDEDDVDNEYMEKLAMDVEI